MELNKDLFIIPIEEGNIIYSPLRRGVFWANKEATLLVRKFLESGRLEVSSDDKVQQYLYELSKVVANEPEVKLKPSTNSLVIILSQICNLACTYCYAQEARSKEVLSKDKLKIAYDFVLADANPEKYFTFIGGGEPFVTWDTIEWSINYINQHKSTSDKVSFSITSNATLFDDYKIAFCKENNIHIGVSFEIIKNVQDSQRPFYKSSKSTFDVIHNNIKRLIDSGISFGIRSTITKQNVSLMPEMVKFVVDNYPTLKRLHFEQVTDSSQNNADFYKEFIDYFFKARTIGKECGIDVYNSISNSVFRIKHCFCGGETCITPTGAIVACHRISSENDKGYNVFNYGRITKEGLEISDFKYNSYLEFTNRKKQECEECFAFWHCAGICPMERVVLSDQQLLNKCDFTREIVKRILIERIIQQEK